MHEHPTGSAVRSESRDAYEIAEPPSTPRVWTAFAAIAVALAGSIAVQIVVILIFIGSQIAQGGNLQDVTRDLPSAVTAPALFIGMTLLSQLVMGAAAIVPARLSPQDTSRRLGLLRPRLPAWGYSVVMVGALFPLGLGVAAAHWIGRVIPPDASVAMLYEQLTSAWAVPFILVIALAPGLMEELLFRGYLQRRLLERWRPWPAILVTSLVFGIFHVTPHAIVAALVIGVWLGVLAWRTGSVWPGVLCHAFINGTWNIWQVGERLWGFPESPPVIASVCGGAVIVACFAVSVWLIWTPAAPVERSAGR